MTKTQPKNYSEQIAQFNWYQQIPLGNGGHTPGEDNFTEEKLPMLKMPTDLSGRSVLDIGCSEGYFGREAERRGAERILGIDKAEKLVEKNALLREITGSRMTYEEKTVYDLNPISDGKFDLVIFLSVFQHLDYPFLALDVIAKVTSTTAIMEIPIAVANNNDDAFQLEPYAISRRSAKGRRIFLPNEALLLEMLLDAGFTATDFITRHRARDVPGYDARFRQERLILHTHRSTSARL